MRPTLKAFGCLLAIGAGLFVASVRPVWPEEAAKAAPGLKELQQKRLAVLESVRDSAQVMFSHGRAGYDDVHTASIELFEARLAYSETREERTRACDEALKEAVAWQEIAQTNLERALSTRIPVLRAEAYVLRIQIERKNVEAEK